VSFVSDDDRPAAIAQRIRHNAYLLQALRLVDRDRAIAKRPSNARRTSLKPNLIENVDAQVLPDETVSGNLVSSNRSEAKELFQ